MLREIKYVENIGRFARGQSVSNAVFGACSLVFGENGWGKSTIADVLRSLSEDRPDILTGRKTLAGGQKQKAVLKFGDQIAQFESASWTGIRPKIAVFDSVFVNDNVFSGDLVTNEHLVNQYGMVVGEEGVRRVHRILELDGENRENNAEIRNLESKLDGIIRGIGPQGMSRQQFIKLGDISGIDDKITEKEKEVLRASRAKELKTASVPQLLPVPTETEELRQCLHSTIQGIAESAAEAVRKHIERHADADRTSSMTHESWLESGAAFVEEKECAFCGQPLDNRLLVDSYSEFFSDAYKKLANDVKAKRDTFSRYTNQDYRNRAQEILKRNMSTYTYWKDAGQIEAPNLGDIENTIAAMEAAARLADAVFVAKQENMTEAATGVEVEKAMTDWNEGRKSVIQRNEVLNAYVLRVNQVKATVDSTELPRLQSEHKTLVATKERHGNSTAQLIMQLEERQAKKKKLAEEKSAVKKELNEHGRKITEALGKTINSYLVRLNAGFKVDYHEPNYKGKEPAASYQILINDVPIAPRNTADSVAKPSFRNTLSAGDKSTLALALFLAKVNADPELSETIVVLDDPFTSLDNFRRQFTANEIRKLCGRSAQTIVLSHDKNFLRLLWDKIEQSTIKCIAIQTGGPGITTIAPYDIKFETRARYVTERMKIEEFVEGEPHDPAYIRTRLRTVCEDFYRRGDQSLFHEAASLDQIIRRLEDAPNDHPYKRVLEDLREVNEYSRREHHAEIQDDPYGESSDEELKGFSRRVLQLTCGM